MLARFCYVDECGFGLYTSRTTGKAVEDFQQRKQQGTNAHRILQCFVQLIHQTIIVGRAKQCHFDQFIQEWFYSDFRQPFVERQGFDKTHVLLDKTPCYTRGVENRLSVRPSTPSDGTTFVSSRSQLLLNIYPGAIQSITQAATLNAIHHVVFTQLKLVDSRIYNT